MNLTFLIIASFSSGSILFATVTSQEIGESCLSSNNEAGVCVPQSDCLKAQENKSVKQSDVADTCKIQSDGTPVICCVVRSTDRNKENRTNNSNGDEYETRIFSGPHRKTTSSRGVSSKPTIFEPSYSSYSANNNGKSSSTSHSKKDEYKTRAMSSQNTNSFNRNTLEHGQSSSEKRIGSPDYYTYDSYDNRATNPFSEANEVVFRPASTAFDEPTDESIHFPGHNNQGSSGYQSNTPSNRPTTSTRPNSNQNTRPSNTGSSIQFPSNQNSQNTRPSSSASSNRPTGSTNNGDFGTSGIQYPSGQNNHNTRPSSSSNSNRPTGSTNNGDFDSSSIQYPNNQNSQNTRPSSSASSNRPTGSTNNGDFGTSGIQHPNNQNNQNTRPNSSASSNRPTGSTNNGDFSTSSNQYPSNQNSHNTRPSSSASSNRPTGSTNNGDFGTSGIQHPNNQNNQNTRPSSSASSNRPTGSTNNGDFSTSGNQYPSNQNSHNTRPSSSSSSNRPTGSTNIGDFGSSSIQFPSNQNTRPSGTTMGTRPTSSNNGGDGFQNPSSQNTRPSSTGPSNHGNQGSTSGGFGSSNGNHGTSGTGFGSSNSNHGSSTGSSGTSHGNVQTGSNNRPATSTQRPIWGSTSYPRPDTENTSSTNSGTRPQSQQKRISEQKCKEYTKYVTQVISALPLLVNYQTTQKVVTDCDFTATSLIVGGEKTRLGEFPHMVAIGFRTGSVIGYECGGTLISEEYVLTAAHCILTSYGSPVNVRLGDLNVVRDDDGAQPLTVNVASTVVHPNYKPPQLYNDIALIRLSRSIPFSKTLRPACLQVSRQINSPNVTATGWGSTNYGETSSDHLLKVGLSLIDNKLCKDIYGSDNKLGNGIADTMLCAGELDGKKDTCQGDSGGPLEVADPNNHCIHYVVGVTSFGRSCGAKNSPGIYTRVSDYVPWIEGIVWKNQRT